jgi:hypothetical protein
MMAGGRSPLKQIALPFAEGEASHAERWNDLVIALHRIGRQCDCEMATFVRWVFNTTAGGTSGSLTKSYVKLADRPLGLCCSTAKARSTVEQAERLGLVVVTRCRRYDGAQLDNAYEINWDGVMALKHGGRNHPHHWAPHAAGQQGPASGKQGGALPQHLFKEDSLSKVSSSDTGPGAAPNPTDKDSDFSDANEGRPRMAAFSTAQPTQSDSLMDALLGQSPILTAARERLIAPLPAGNLLHGVYAPIKWHHLHEPLRFVKWHRMQLSTAVPVMDNTEADLLLIIATALYATSLRDSEVTKTRAAVFVGTIARRKFLRSLPFVPQARTLLDEGIRRHGLAWVGLADETTPAEVQKVEAGA